MTPTLEFQNLNEKIFPKLVHDFTVTLNVQRSNFKSLYWAQNLDV